MGDKRDDEEGGERYVHGFRGIVPIDGVFDGTPLDGAIGFGIARLEQDGKDEVFHLACLGWVSRLGYG